jgi:hypothetical protein
MNTILVYRNPKSGDPAYDRFFLHLANTVPVICGDNVKLEFRNTVRSKTSYKMFVCNESITEDEWGRLESVHGCNEREYAELCISFKRACEVAKTQVEEDMAASGTAAYRARPSIRSVRISKTGAVLAS